MCTHARTHARTHAGAATGEGEAIVSGTKRRCLTLDQCKHVELDGTADGPIVVMKCPPYCEALNPSMRTL